MPATSDVSLERWWNDPGEYRWLIGFLEDRGLATAMKRVLAGIGALLAVLAAVMPFGSHVADDPVSRVLLVVVVLLGLAWAVRWWLWDWPSLRVSIALAAMGDLAITMAALLHSDPLAALAGTPLFAVIGYYIAFFHTPKVHAWHVALVTVTVVGLTIWLAIQQGPGGVLFAATKGCLTLLLSVGLLPVLHYGFWVIQRSFVDSLADPLTELTNRRGLDGAIRRLRTRSGADAPLSILWIDLDGFKSINDNHGHPTGDAVLVRIARCIEHCVDPRAVVARLGGEEFLVVDTIPGGEAASVAECIRTAIELSDEPRVTASIGVATAPPKAGDELDGLIQRADEAMYEAKRRGGDQVVCGV